jgi:hypothetical protein
MRKSYTLSLFFSLLGASVEGKAGKAHRAVHPGAGWETVPRVGNCCLGDRFFVRAEEARERSEVRPWSCESALESVQELLAALFGLLAGRSRTLNSSFQRSWPSRLRHQSSRVPTSVTLLCRCTGTRRPSFP